MESGNGPSAPSAGAVLRSEDLRPIVHKYWPVYDARFESGGALFFVTVDPATLEDRFEALRLELKPHLQVPMLRYQGGEYQVLVVPRFPVDYHSTRTNAVLFVATVITTTLAGAISYFGYVDYDLAPVIGQAGEVAALAVMFAPQNLFGGFFLFALPLMFILGAHEMGHYLAARRHGVAASLPFFVPLPPFVFELPLGTMGAFINLREPIPNRKVLLDIGIAGPLVGFLVMIPVLLLGLWLQTEGPVTLPAIEGLGFIGTPLAYLALSFPFPLADNQLIHPTAFAAWVALLATGLNLLPAGQLDGGHIAHALLGRNAIYLSYLAVAILIVLGFGIPALGAFPGFAGWGGWIFLALLIAILGLQHGDTLNTVTILDPRRLALALCGLVLLAITFTPTPVSF